MNTLTLHARTGSTVLRAMPPYVYVAGRRRRDLRAVAWRDEPAPRFGGATFAQVMSDPFGRTRRIEDLPDLPAVGEPVRVRRPDGRGEVLFDGVVSAHLGRVGPDAEKLAFEAADALAVALSAPPAGRWQADGDGTVFVPGAPLVFNDEADGLASATVRAVGGRAVRVFDAGDDRGLWSVADILAHLLAAIAPAGATGPDDEELAALGGDVYPARMDLSGLSAAEALARAAAAAGLAVRGGVDESGGTVARHLALFRPGRTGRRRPVRLQRAGQPLDVRRSELWTGRLDIRRRPARRPLLLIGDRRRYEVTVPLQPGWDPSLESYHYRDFVTDEAADPPTTGEVFRRWVLNETGRYGGPPWNLEAFDFAQIDAENFLVAAPRTFRPCLSVGPGGEGMGIVVEFSTDEGGTWRRYGGSVHLSGAECALTIADAALPADYFQAALDLALQLRVTATVAADRTLSAALAGDAGAPLEVIRVPNARWAKVHATSTFFGRTDLPAPAELDDTQRLESLARHFQAASAEALEGEIVLARVDPTWRCGDIVDRIEGRGLDLRTSPGAAAHVAVVEHRCDETWTTTLSVRG